MQITTCNALITTVTGMPTALVKTLTWDQGSEMAAHAAFSLATNVAVYFAHPTHPGNAHQREHQRPAPRILPKHRDHRRPNLPLVQPSSTRPRDPGLPNPSRSLRRPPSQLNCFTSLLTSYAGCRIPRGPSYLPRPGRFVRRVGGVNGGAGAIAVPMRCREAPFDSGVQHGRFRTGERVTQNPRILGPLLWLFVDNIDYLRFSQLQTLVTCGHFGLSGWVL